MTEAGKEPTDGKANETMANQPMKTDPKKSKFKNMEE